MPELIAVASPVAVVNAMTDRPLAPELVAVALPPPIVSAPTPLLTLPELVAVALPPVFVTAWSNPPVIVPEFVAVALPPRNVAALTSPLSLPVLVAVALPPFVVTASMPPTLAPELFTVALPPPVVSDSKALAVPVLLVVAFWFAPTALLRKNGAVPELVQLMSLVVVVHMNCADAGEVADKARIETAAGQHNACVNAKSAVPRPGTRRFHTER